VGDLARPLGMVGAAGVIGAIADEGEVAAVRVFAGETVAATRRREFARRARPAAACGYGLVQAIDRAAAVNVEHHDHRRSRTA